MPNTMDDRIREAVYIAVISLEKIFTIGMATDLKLVFKMVWIEH